MVQVIRWAAGSDWQPADLHLQSHDGAHLRDSELMQRARLRFGCGEAAVALSPALLALPLRQPVNSASRELSPACEPERDFRWTITEIVRSHVRGRCASLHQVATVLDISERTLQRRLTERGLVFSGLVEQARAEMAFELLSNTAMPVQDIAREMGYQEATHFSRAFKRITGNSPTAYRRQAQSSSPPSYQASGKGLLNNNHPS